MLNAPIVEIHDHSLPYYESHPDSPCAPYGPERLGEQYLGGKAAYRDVEVQQTAELHLVARLKDDYAGVLNKRYEQGDEKYEGYRIGLGIASACPEIDELIAEHNESGKDEYYDEALDSACADEYVGHLLVGFIESTATATVPDTAPRMNCPVLQYMRSMMVFRKIQKE